MLRIPRAAAARLTRAALLTVLAAAAGGCQAYRRNNVPIPGGPERSLAERVRIITDSGFVHELRNAKVLGDSVIGAQWLTGARTAVAITHIRKVEEWGTSGWRTAGAVAGTTLLVAGALFVAAMFLFLEGLAN